MAFYKAFDDTKFSGTWYEHGSYKILRYTSEVQQILGSKVKAEPWMHIVIVGLAKPECYGYTIYVWDTRKVLESESSPELRDKIYDLRGLFRKLQAKDTYQKLDGKVANPILAMMFGDAATSGEQINPSYVEYVVLSMPKKDFNEKDLNRNIQRVRQSLADGTSTDPDEVMVAKFVVCLALKLKMNNYDTALTKLYSKSFAIAKAIVAKL